ncbi:MAG TPA: permease prefix domain 1-containing protein [Aeromicrobium sp.]|nr:permease prefix domain 1-containing protein [Aeromicrobium sp.]
MTDHLSELDDQIGQWRQYIQRSQTIAPGDAAEMEDHLRGQIDDLVETGLAPDEAFLVAVKRMGSVDEISREFAREHAERLWKQLVLTGTDGTASPGLGRNLVIALGFAIAAAVALKSAVTWLEGEDFGRNLALIVLPFVTGYLAWTRRLGVGALAVAAAVYTVAALVMNLYPWRLAQYASESTTEILAATHLPILLWLIAGLAYVGGQWSSHARRMDFIRFTGEWVVYLALLALGGIVVTGLTIASFTTLNVADEDTIASWIIPIGAAGATVVAAWLVEAKQAVVENIAPVLTKVFTPVTLLLLVALLSALAVRLDFADLERDLLLIVDLILALVLGLVLYAVSARDPHAEPELFDRLQFVLLAVALATDAVLLVAMITRIADAGFTANKVAALGMNLVLLVNLIGSTRLLARFNRGTSPFAALERWQTAYLPVYGIWAAFVVFALPPIFRFA